MACDGATVNEGSLDDLLVGLLYLRIVHLALRGALRWKAFGDPLLPEYNLHAMDEREFFIPLPDAAALRVRYLKDRGRILRFVVQLEALIDQNWFAIVRYDNAHQFVHRDDLKPDGTQIKTPPMAFANNEDALNFALQDLRTNYQFYIRRYWQWRLE